MTIGRKIMSGYAIILLIVCLLTLVLTAITLRVSLRRVAISELKSQGQAIVELVSKQGIGNEQWQNPVLFRRNMHMIDGVSDADIYILSGNGNLIYRTSDSLTLQELKDIREQTSHVYSITPVEGRDGETLGRVILVRERKSDTAIVRTTLRVILYAVVIAGLIGLFVGYLIQRNIVSPLKRMTGEVNQIDDISEVKLTPIQNSDELGTLYHGFMRMLNRLKASDEERKRFFQNSSHELKTPLMSIQGYAEAIRDGVMEGEEEKEALNIIIGKSGQLKEIVENLTLLSQAENKGIIYQMENIDLEHVLGQWLKHYMETSIRQGVEVSLVNVCEGKVQAFTDGSQLIKVMEILLDNGLRYARSFIRIILDKDESGNPVIKVANDGEAIREVDRERIFERFYAGKGGKSGLGLSIAKSIIEGQGGRIALENGKSVGVVFLIRLCAGRTK